MWAWGQAFRGRMFDDSSLPTFEAFAEDWREQERRGRRSWAVSRNGELGGCLISTRLSPDKAELHLLFKKTFWGRATTRTALWMVCAQIFAAGVDTIESTVPADAGAVLALVKTIGARREHIGQSSRNGMPVDMIGLVLERNDFVAKGVVAR